MLKKGITLALALLLLHVGAPRALADTPAEKEARHVEKVRKNILKLGTGEDARVSLELKNRAKVKGYVVSASGDSFVVNDAQTGSGTTVAYADVKKVNGKNLSTGAWIAIGAGAAAVVILTILYFMNAGGVRYS